MIERHLLPQRRAEPCVSRNLAAPCLQRTGQTWRRVTAVTLLDSTVKKQIILFPLTSSERTRHRCGLQTSG